MLASATTQLGRSAVEVSRLAAGMASLGNVFGAVDEGAASDLLRSCADAGVRYLDTAPLYGLGLSERRLGAALGDYADDAFVLSTKVGRTLSDESPEGWVYDLSRDAILRGFESSLERLGRARVDVLYLHDPDEFESQVYESAWPTLVELRDQGTVGAIGVGMNQWQMPLDIVRRLDVDVVLLAGRYTILDTSGADELLPECLERGVAVALGGVFNSGVLIDPAPGAWFDYRPATEAVLTRATAIRTVAARYGISLAHVALAFASAHPAVTSTIVGVGSGAMLTEHAQAMAKPVPVALWRELQASGLLPQLQFVLGEP